MGVKYEAVESERLKKYLARLPVSESGKILSAIAVMAEGDFALVRTKKLEGPIRELIVGRHRITYFLLERNLYFVSGFMKKSRKAPKDEIAYARSAYTEQLHKK